MAIKSSTRYEKIMDNYQLVINKFLKYQFQVYIRENFIIFLWMEVDARQET
jgi:hypothetical protein